MTQDGKTIGNEYESPTDLKYKQISTGEIQLDMECPSPRKNSWLGITRSLSTVRSRRRSILFPLRNGIRKIYNRCIKNDPKVNFYPQEGVTYGVYIKQGNREYEESFTQLKSGKINSVTLKNTIRNRREAGFTGSHSCDKLCQ